MNGRAHIRLGHEQGRRLAHQMTHFLGHHGAATGVAGLQDMGAGIAQDAEARALDQAHFVTALAARKIVLAHAQQGEVVVGQPFEEGGRLLDFLTVQRRRRQLNCGDGFVQLGQHGLPVVDRGAHVGQDFVQRRPDFFDRLGRGLPGDLDMHPRFVGIALERGQADRHIRQPAGGAALDPQDGMHGEIDGKTRPVQPVSDRIDEKRHVVVDDLDHRAAGLPALRRGLGIEDAQLRPGGFALGGKPAQAHGRAVKVGDRALDDILRRDALVIELDEAVGVGRLLFTELVK